MEQPILCLSVVTCRTDHEKEGDSVPKCLRLPRTCHGLLHVTDTHTHHHIYSVTVVMPRPHVKITRRDFKGESHMFELKEGAEGRELFEFEGGVR